MTRRAGEQGFSLMEVLVGLAILSAVLATSYSSMSHALKTTLRVAQRQAAIQKVAQEVEQLRRQPLMHSQVLQGEAENYKWRITVERAEGSAARPVVPFRITGRLTSKSGDGGSVTVIDTFILGRGR